MRALLLASAAMTSIAVAAPAAAQDTASSQPEKRRPANQSTTDDDIIVTATRKPERLQDVPLSITAFSQEQLTAKGIVGYEALARETPGVVLNKQSDNFNNFTARGIATNTYGANLQSTVAIYIDELPITSIGNTTTIDPNLFDVERVEFLRGPQGTLFGSGSLSGALRILNKNPDLKAVGASALVDVGLTGSDSVRQRYNAMVNIPLLTDKVAVRAVGFYRHEDGFIDNLGTGVHNANTLVDWGGRFILLAKPTDRLSFRFLASYENNNPEDASLQSPSLGRNKRFTDRPDLYTAKVTNLNATIEYQFDGAKFTSSSTFSRSDVQFHVDLQGTFGGFIPFALDADGLTRTFVEEARLTSDPGGKFDYVVGGFYLHRDADTGFNFRSTVPFLSAHGITGLPDEYYERFTTNTQSHELAAFGEVTYRFTNKFWVTGGLRYGGFGAQSTTYPGGFNSNYFTLALTGASGPLTIIPIAAGPGTRATASRPSFKASLSWKPSSNLTTYATVSTGFRTPVLNAQAGSRSIVNPNDIVIPSGASSDNLKNYELGAKGRWLGGKLSVNAAIFWIDWQNIQVQANRVSDSIQFATNIGAARSRGAEFEITILPVKGLTIGLNGAYVDAKVTKLSASEAAISGAVLGARLASPKFQGAAYLRYQTVLTGRVEGFVSADIQHVGSYPNMFPNVPGNPNVRVATYGVTDSYNNVDFQLGVVSGPLTISAYLENAFDDHSITYIHPEAFIASRYGTLRPRTVGMRAGYKF
jgi:iron complex outermembrane receptor protein